MRNNTKPQKKQTNKTDNSENRQISTKIHSTVKPFQTVNVYFYCWNVSFQVFFTYFIHKNINYVERKGKLI